MKISKKIIVSSLSTALGVSLVGAISGTVAWYQYNTQARTSIIGVNVAETGVLEISTTGGEGTFKRDLVTSDLVAGEARLTPITWGVNADQANTALPAKAYKNPDSALNRKAKDAAGQTEGAYADVYQAATTSDYVQYTLYIRGRTVDNVSDGYHITSEKVYLTDFTLANATENDEIADGMRVHLACYNDSTGAVTANYLIANSAKTINLYGELDCDGDGFADRIGGYEWQSGFDDVVVYGAQSYTQTTVAPTSLVVTPGAGGVIDHAANTSKLLVTTPQDGMSKIVVTIWYEGWDTYKTSSVKYITASKPDKNANVEGKYTNRYATGDALTAGSVADGTSTYYTKGENKTVPMWSGYKTDGAKFNFGMTFAVSSNAFTDEYVPAP